MMGKPLHDQVARCGWPGHCGWSGHDGSWGMRPRMIRGVYWRSVWIGDPGDEFGRGPGSDGMGPKGMGPDGVWMSGHAKSAPPTWTTRITSGWLTGLEPATPWTTTRCSTD